MMNRMQIKTSTQEALCRPKGGLRAPVCVDRVWRRAFVAVGPAMLSAALLLTGCSKEPVWERDTRSQISVDALFPATVSAGAATRAAADGNTALTLSFVRADESASGTFGAYGAEFTGTRDAGAAEQALTFDPVQYYLTDGLKTRMAGWYPGGATASGDASGKGYYDAAAGTVTWTIDGGQDILLAAPRQGSKSAKMPVFEFRHALAQLQFSFYAESEAALEQWGKIRGVAVRGQRAAAAFTLAGATDDNLKVTFTGEAAQTFAAANFTELTARAGKDNAAGGGDPVMIAPQETPCRLTVEVMTEHQGVQTAVVSARAYAAGEAVKICIRLAEQELIIDPEGCEIVPWAGDATGATGREYPYVLDGHTLVLQDMSGMADPAVYPLHELWTETPAHRETTWETMNPDNKSGYNTAGIRFQVASADAGSLTWTAAQTACASYTENGIEGWRLPTMTEWHAIYACKANLTAAGLPSTGVFWSATEFGVNYGWNLRIEDGEALSEGSKQGLKKVRCVRDMVSSADKYPYITEGHTIVLKDEKGAADEALYPLHGSWYKTPAHAEKLWNANESGHNGLGERFRVAKADARGRDGSAMAFNWYEASGTVHTTLNPIGFSACAFYSEEADKNDLGLWRLPTEREMKLILDRKGDLGRIGALTTNARYWAAAGLDDRSAWVVDGGSTLPGSILTTYDARVRCVRDNGARESRGWPYALNGTTIVVKDAYGQADASKYPIHAPWPVTPVNKSTGRNYNQSGLNLMGQRYEITSVRVATSSWADAAAKCAAYSQEAGDAGTWRLPTAKEVGYLNKYKNELTLAMKYNDSPDYWSATESSETGKETHAYAFNTSNDNSSLRFKTGNYYVICVRDVVDAGVKLYPYVSDGNTIVVKDAGGAADPVAFPTHEAWTKTPEHAENNWYNNATDWNSLGERLLVAKADAAAPTSLADAESKCAGYAEVSDGSDAGLWRMPTLREMLAIGHEFRHLVTKVNALTSGKNYVSRTAMPTGAHYAVAPPSNVVSLSDWSNNPALRCVRDEKCDNAYPYRSGNIIIAKDEHGVVSTSRWNIRTTSIVDAKIFVNLEWNYFTTENYLPTGLMVAAKDAVGKDRSSATMTWYEAVGTTNSSHNPDTYDACLYYSERSDHLDVGYWRLPSPMEMTAMGELGFLEKGKTYCTTQLADGTTVWDITMTKDGSLTHEVHLKDYRRHVRCVRDENTPARSKSYPYAIRGVIYVIKDMYGGRSNCTYKTVDEYWTSKNTDKTLFNDYFVTNANSFLVKSVEGDAIALSKAQSECSKIGAEWRPLASGEVKALIDLGRFGNPQDQAKYIMSCLRYNANHTGNDKNVWWVYKHYAGGSMWYAAQTESTIAVPRLLRCGRTPY